MSQAEQYHSKHLVKLSEGNSHDHGGNANDISNDSNSNTSSGSNEQENESDSIGNNNINAVIPTQFPMELPIVSSLYYKSTKLSGPAMKKLNKFVNTIVGSQFASTYGTFISFTDPILLDCYINLIVDKTFELMPKQCKIIMTLYGFASRLNTTRSQHLGKFYRQMTFYTLVAMARTRFNQNFVQWAMIGAAAVYGQSDKQAGRQVPVFFGHSCSYSSFYTQSKEYRNIPAYYKKVETVLLFEKIQLPWP